MSRRTLWFFQRTGPGAIRRISNPWMQRFLAGERALRHDGDGFVRCIGMSLEVHGNKPAQVARVWFSKIRVNDEGRVDPHHRHETAKLARSETPQAAHSHAGPSVVAAGHRFAMRRLSHLREWRAGGRDPAALPAGVHTNAREPKL